MKRWQGFRILGIIVSLNGCSQTTYSGFESSGGTTPFQSRMVRFEMSDWYFRDPPDCITVLPVKDVDDRRFTGMVEEAVARHLSGKIKRIIGPVERQNLERRLAFDLGNVGDRRRFTGQMQCRHYAQPEINNVENTYALVWAEKNLDLGLRIHGYDDKILLWRASHRASRGDGGLPVSPFSLGTALFSAGRAHNDRDMFPSMVDDSFRRMLKKLPDTRQF